MATVGNLLVNMSLESAKFSSGLKKASRETGSAMTGIKNAARQVGGIFSTVFSGGIILLLLKTAQYAVALVNRFGSVGAALDYVKQVAREVFGALRTAMSGLGDAAKALGLAIKGIFDASARDQAVVMMQRSVEKFRAAWDGARGTAGRFMAEVRAGMGLVDEDTDKAGKTAGRAARAIKSMKAAADDAAQAAAELAKRWSDLLDKLQPWRAPMREYREAIDLIGQMERAAGQAQGAFDELRQAARGRWLNDLGIESVATTISQMKADMADIINMPSLTARLQQDVQAQIDAVYAPFKRAEEGAERIKGMLVQGVVYGQDIGKALVNSFKAAAAEAAIGGLFKLQGIGAQGGGILNTVFGWFGGARAGGGPVQAGKAYLVGEKGPELLLAGQSGYVMNNKDAFGGGRAGGNIITIDARQATDPQAIASAVRLAIGASAQYTDGRFSRAMRVNLRTSPGAA